MGSYSVERSAADSVSTIAVSICVCTFRRPELLENCLVSLVGQNATTPYEVVVVDNDARRSASTVCESLQARFAARGIPLRYLSESVQNIALARNRAVAAAVFDLIAFIDDDEAAGPEWLSSLISGITSLSADGVFGPVQPIFPESYPKWLQTSILFYVPSFKDGKRLKGDRCATGNALIKKSMLLNRSGPFNPEIGKVGGSDVELFTWLVNECDANWRWWAKAKVEERQEEHRRHLHWHQIRAFRRGWTYSRMRHHSIGRWKALGLVMFQVPFSMGKFIFVSLRTIRNPRGALWNLLVGVAGNVGKIGYFLGIRVEEYKEKE